jgi:tetratricopeptide (TPR) repeat protein
MLLVASSLLLATHLSACTRTAPTTAGPTATSSVRAREATELLTAARTLLKAGDYGRAEQYAEQAARIGVDQRQVIPILLESCIRDQRLRAAVEHGRNYLKRYPDDQATRLLLAALHGVLGDSDVARREFETVIVANPNCGHAHYALAVLLRDEVGNYAAADLHFREYLRIDPQGAHRAEAVGALLSRVQ